MTTNIDRATEVIGGWIDAYLPHSEDNFGADEDIARALADAGLLRPDLPEPTCEYTSTWIVDDLEIEAMNDFVYIGWSDGMDDMRGTTTRSLHLDKRMVLAILAAHATWEVTDE